MTRLAPVLCLTVLVGACRGATASDAESAETAGEDSQGEGGSSESEGSGESGGDGDGGESDDGDGGEGGGSGGVGPTGELACSLWSPDDEAPVPPSGPPDCEEDGVPCPTFVDVSAEAGIEHDHYFDTSGAMGNCLFGLPTPNGLNPNVDCEPGWFAAGAAVADVDENGFPDIYMTILGQPDRLYMNQGDGTFVDEAVPRGLGDCTFTNGAIFGDIDNDGDPDLVVSSVATTRHLLYINDGSGAFSEEGHERGSSVDGELPHDGEGIALGDYDGDGWLDLHINEWLRRAQMPEDGSYGPRLLHNQGEGYFEDQTDSAGVNVNEIDADGVYGFSSTFVDLDLDGQLDLAMASDFRNARLFWNLGDGSFLDGTIEAHTNSASNAMGSTFADVDFDGYLDWYVTSIYELKLTDCDDVPPPCGLKGNGNRLYHNDGDRTFSDWTTDADVRNADWAWGAAFFDHDNDGDPDLAVVNGWPGRDLNGGKFHEDTPMRLFDSRYPEPYVEVGAARGLGDRGQGRAVVPIDYDRDGDLDLLIANNAGFPVLYRNDGGNEAAWIELKLEGTATNRDARGAIVRVWAEEGGRMQTQHVGASSHFLAEPELRLHFGLGQVETVARIEVEWPHSGAFEVLEDVPARQLLAITESL